MVIGSALGPLPLGLIEAGKLKEQTRALLFLCIPPVVGAIFVLACKMNPLVPRKPKTDKKKGNVEMQGLLEEDEEEGED